MKNTTWNLFPSKKEHVRNHSHFRFRNCSPNYCHLDSTTLCDPIAYSITLVRWKVQIHSFFIIILIPTQNNGNIPSASSHVTTHCELVDSIFPLRLSLRCLSCLLSGVPFSDPNSPNQFWSVRGSDQVSWLSACYIKNGVKNDTRYSVWGSGGLPADVSLLSGRCSRPRIHITAFVVSDSTVSTKSPAALWGSTFRELPACLPCFGWRFPPTVLEGEDNHVKCTLLHNPSGA